MNLVRCPSCATVFRASGDQIKRRAGLVRCGRCRTVFDALAHVVPDSPLTGETSTATELILPDLPQQEHPSPNLTTEVSGSAPESAIQSTVADSHGNDDNIDTLLDYEVAPRAKEAQPAGSMPFAPQPTPTDEFTQLVPESIDSDDSSGAQTDVPLPPMLPPQDATPLAVHAEANDTTEYLSPESPYDLVDDDARARLRAEPQSMLAWGSSLAVGLVLALLQLVYLYRSDIAQSSPLFGPMIERLCKTMGCSIELPRQAKLMNIEASDLQPDSHRKGRLLLTATLKNRADFAQAYPQLELTLTDSRDKALVRRVFPPDAYLPKRSKADTGFAANAEQTVRLLIETTGVGATGYRLYIFYP